MCRINHVFGSGVSGTCIFGLIRQMVSRAAGRISVMPGCGLTPENGAGVLAANGATEAHAACRTAVPGDLAFSDFDPPGGRFETSEAEVHQMVAALSER